VVAAGQARMRPILITALTLMAGAYMILDDLIFKGMAVSLLYGASVATVLTLVVMPLGCISVSKQFYRIANVGSCPVTGVGRSAIEEPAPVYQLPLWLRIWMTVVSAVTWVYYIARMFFIMVRMGIQSLLERFGGGSEPDLPGGSTPGGTPSGGSPSPAPMPTPSGDGVAVATETMQEAESVVEETTTVEVKEKADSETTQKPVVKKSVTKKVVAKKKSVPKKRAVPKKKAVKKEIAPDSEKTIAASKKKSSAPKKRRGIRLNPGLENE